MTDGIYKVIVIILIAIIFSVICICISMACTAESTNDKTDAMLVEIESHPNYIIMYDKDTKVIYYRGKGGNADLLPLYNTDGSLKLYSGGNNND